MKTLCLTLVSVAVLFAGVRVNINVGVGHPIRRPRTVIVQRAPLVVGPRVVYAAPVVWAPTLVTLPPKPRMVWEDSEILDRRDDWVDVGLPVNNTGDALFLRIVGRAQVDFAEVHFGNGQVQVVDFNEAAVQQGAFRLLDFADGRRVMTVRLVARARTPQATLTLLMKK